MRREAPIRAGTDRIGKRIPRKSLDRRTVGGFFIDVEATGEKLAKESDLISGPDVQSRTEQINVAVIVDVKTSEKPSWNFIATESSREFSTEAQEARNIDES